jgi:hypothetical protein
MTTVRYRLSRIPIPCCARWPREVGLPGLPLIRRGPIQASGSSECGFTTCHIRAQCAAVAAETAAADQAAAHHGALDVGYNRTFMVARVRPVKELTAISKVAGCAPSRISPLPSTSFCGCPSSTYSATLARLPRTVYCRHVPHRSHYLGPLSDCSAGIDCEAMQAIDLRRAGASGVFPETPIIAPCSRFSWRGSGLSSIVSASCPCLCVMRRAPEPVSGLSV